MVRPVARPCPFFNGSPMDRHLRRVTPHVVHCQAIRRKTRHCHSPFYARCSHWSFHAEAPSSAFRWTRECWILGGGAFLLALLTLLGIPAWARVIQHEAVVKPVTRETLALKLPPAPKEAARPVVASWKVVEVQPGETLSEIFQAQGLSGADLAKVMASGKDAGALKTLHPGDQVEFLTGAKGRLQGFRYEPDSATQVTLTAQPDGSLKSQVTALPVERRLHFAHGEVQGSLFAAGEKAGLSETMVLKLADVFKYDIDFIKDLKQGDHFTVVYDDIYRNGKYSGAGNIIAAEFVNNGHRYTAYRFKQTDGEIAYFSEDGRPLRKGLLRTPVAFTRISSTFGMRKHPILGYTRLHKGVDYAAPRGTPIHAAGNGVIVFRGTKHGDVRSHVQARRKARHVTVSRGVFGRVPDRDEIAVTMLGAAEHDHAVTCSMDRRALRGRIIHALVQTGVTQNRVLAHAERGRDARERHRRAQQTLAQRAPVFAEVRDFAIALLEAVSGVTMAIVDEFRGNDVAGPRILAVAINVVIDDGEMVALLQILDEVDVVLEHVCELQHHRFGKPRLLAGREQRTLHLAMREVQAALDRQGGDLRFQAAVRLRGQGHFRRGIGFVAEALQPALGTGQEFDLITRMQGFQRTGILAARHHLGEVGATQALRLENF